MVVSMGSRNTFVRDELVFKKRVKWRFVYNNFFLYLNYSCFGPFYLEVRKNLILNLVSMKCFSKFKHKISIFDFHFYFKNYTISLNFFIQYISHFVYKIHCNRHDYILHYIQLQSNLTHLYKISIIQFFFKFEIRINK